MILGLTKRGLPWLLFVIFSRQIQAWEITHFYHPPHHVSLSANRRWSFFFLKRSLWLGADLLFSAGLKQLRRGGKESHRVQRTGAGAAFHVLEWVGSGGEGAGA